MVLLARRPAAGRVKTRLAAGLGAPAALALHRAFLEDTLRWLRALARRGWRVRVEWSERFRPGAPLARALAGLESGVQARGPLGRRIEAALRRALASGARCAVAVGSDSPHLGAGPAEQARRRLRSADAVLGPAADGGYYLIGVRRLERAWFEGIDWGTSRVLRQSLARMRRSGARPALLAVAYDLDTARSLERLARALRRSRRLRLRLPATRRLLGRLGIGAPEGRRRS